MIIFHKKNTRFDLAFPLQNATTPRIFLTGLSPTITAYSQDGAAAWAILSIADTVSEISTIGVYELTLTAAELNHDRVIIKFIPGATSLDVAVIFDLSPNFAILTLGPTVTP